MRLACPDCGEPIEADNINVNEMIAVCGSCHTVFRFNVPDEKAKRRKTRQPDRLNVREEDGILNMWFTRVLGKEDIIARNGVGFAASFLTMMTFLTTGGFFEGDTPILIPIILGTLMMGAYYVLALIMLDETRIIADEHQISLHYKPLPNPFDEAVQVDFSDIETIICEETEESQKAGSLKRYYYVGAELVDGNHVLIVKDKPEQYAKYIAQRLEEKLYERSADVALRLREEIFTEDEVIDSINTHSTGEMNALQS